MTYKEAKQIVKEFDHNATPMGEDFFLYTEAMEYLLRTEDDPFQIMLFGTEFGARGRPDIARKYYEKAAAMGDPMSMEALGTLYYWGKSVNRNLEMAEKYARQAYETDDRFGSFFGGALLAKIYSSEDFPGRNIEVSRRLLEELVERTEKDEGLSRSASDVFEDLGDIYLAGGEEDKALPLYLKSKHYTAAALASIRVPDSQRDVEAIMEKLHRLSSYQPDEYDLYDLYWLMKEPATVSFEYGGERFQVQSFVEDSELHIRFGDCEYRSVADFIEKAEIDGKRIQELFFELDSMEVVG